MTTVPKDLIYYLNPVNTPTYPIPEDAQIVVLEARDRNDAMVGEVMPVTGVWHDDIRIWYRGGDGNYYDGPMLGRGAARASYAIDIEGEGAVFGYINNTYSVASGTGYGLSYASRWDGKQVRINGSVVAEHYGLNCVPAASWASDLWPIPTDHEDIRAAKIALAKQKWETQIKHLAIIREAQRRDWLYILEGHDFLREQGMKRPIYGAFVSGNVALSANQSIAIDDLSSRAQSTIGALTNFRNGSGTTFDTQIQVPVQFMYPGNGPIREGQGIHSIDPSSLTSHFQVLSGNYDVSVNANNVQPTITGLSY